MSLGKEVAMAVVRSLSPKIARLAANKMEESKMKAQQRREDEQRALEQRQISAFRSGEKHAKASSYGEALQEFQKSYDLGLKSNACKYNMGICYTHLGNYDHAISFIKDAMNIEGAKETLATIYIYDGIKNKEREKYLLDMRKAEAYNIGTEEEIKNMINEITIELADYYINGMNELDSSSIDVIKDAIEITALNEKYISAVAKYYFDNGNYESAIYYCEKVNGEYEENTIIETYAKSLKELDDKSEKSVHIYKEYLKLNPKDTDILLYLGEIFSSVGKHQEVINLYKKGLDLEKSNSRLRCCLAKKYIDIQEIDNAVVEIQTLLNTEQPTNEISSSELHLLLGMCFLKKRMYRIALKQFLMCENKTSILDYLYVLGKIFDSEEDIENARTCWEEIYSIDATYKDVSTRII